MRFVIGLVAVCSLMGCATTNKNLDRKLTTIEPASQQQISDRATTLIQDSSSLTAEQKKSLLSLKDNVRKELESIQQQSLKLRTALVQDVVATDYNSDEVDLIKSRMKKLENKKLSLMFDAVENANRIIGRNTSLDREILMIDMMGGPRL